MKKYVLDVGNCGPDHISIKNMLLRTYDVEVLRAHELSDTLTIMAGHEIALVLINRKLDIDYSDGMEILKHLKADSHHKSVPVMLVTNHAEYQAAAIAEGAEAGFGKLELNASTTFERLDKFLDRK